MDVKLYVYDLSQGLARQASRQFLGTQIDAIYHTSLVFGGVEYFFGRGIQTASPGSTHHGRPMEVLSLGQTSLPQDLIIDYLESLAEIYSPESYDLFAHNCNNFTNDFAMFLLGKGIPDHITSLPKTVLDTPFGQMLRPQIDMAMRPVTQAPTGPQPATARNGPGPASSISPNGTVSSATNGQAPNGLAGKVQNATTVQQFDHILDQARRSCAVVFFTSASCAPCKLLYPVYDDLAAEAVTKAIFIKVDVSMAREVGMRYSISATPTFMTFLKGEQFDRWTGSDAAQLRGNVRVLLQSAFPPHPHQTKKLVHLPRLGSTKPITYSKVPPLGKLKEKMGEQGQSKQVEDCISFISNRQNGENAQSVPVPDLPEISSFLLQSLHVMPSQNLFTIYDLFRILLMDPRISGYFLAETSLTTVLTLLTHVTGLQQQQQNKASASSPAIPYNLHLCAIHVSCNLFTSTLLPDTLNSSQHAEQLLSVLLALLTPAVLDESHPALRVAASSLAYNLAKLENAERVYTLETNGAVSSLMSQSGQVELAVALIEAIPKSVSSASAGSGTTDEVAAAAQAALRYQAVALAHLLYLAPVDGGELFDLCDALDAQATLSKASDQSTGSAKDTKKDKSESAQTQGLLREICLLLDAR